jgi:hypothetical protein
MATPNYDLRQKVLDARAAGRTFTQIAADLGISRGAVSGYVHRANGYIRRRGRIPTPPSPPLPLAALPPTEPPKHRYHPPKQSRATEKSTPPAVVKKTPVGPDGVPLSDVGLFQCRWIVGRDSTSPALVRFCGRATTHAESSWCATHSGLVYAPKYTRDMDRRFKHDLAKGRME